MLIPSLFQACTFDKQQPFRHLIIKDLIISQWFGGKGEGVKYPEAFKGIPLPLLALVECALRSYISGVKASWTINFSGSEFSIRYIFYAQKLDHLRKNSLTWCKGMTKELYRAVW
ncbi:hypothetical protein PAXRUDRAFT_154333 [Paxillus rubicundulus Ve08.2h10]|uniref:DUF6532 domain-containing protein n=1 Tax=Paxillus rubicundulus Ve08.2h10 TaxID=930991 RepID=A0A0D0DD36_9AGAM|nr:hypothetical protein PAXRUDRAFT_154333 [Paxillus rubicundulus Ve08.2h10]